LLATPGADHIKRRPVAGTIERTPQNLTIDGDDTLALPGKRRHETLKGGGELVRVKQPEQPAERIMARYAIFRGEEAT
jgi:hypothetical protein